MSNKWTPNKLKTKNNVEQVEPQQVEEKQCAKSSLHKPRRTHRRAVMAVMVAVAVAAVVAVVTAAAVFRLLTPRGGAEVFLTLIIGPEK